MNNIELTENQQAALVFWEGYAAGRIGADKNTNPHKDKLRFTKWNQGYDRGLIEQDSSDV